MAEKDFKLAFGVDISELVSGMTAAQEAVTESSLAMKESLATVSEGFGAIGEAMAALTTILAGGAAFKEMVGATVDLNVSSMQLAKQFGMSATEASVLKVALDEAFVTQDTYSGAAARLTRTLSTNEGAFHNVGIATRDTVTGGFRPMVDIMEDVVNHLATVKEGADRNVEATRLMGRGWQQYSEVMRLAGVDMAGTAEKAKDLNLVVSVESEAATQAYRSAMVELKETLEGVKNTIGQALLPALTQLANWFSSDGPGSISKTRAAIAFLGTGFADLRHELKDEIDWIIGEFVSLEIEIEKDVAAINRALHFDWAGAKADMKAKIAEQQAVFQGYTEDLVANAKQANDLIASLTATPTSTPTAPGGGADIAIEAAGKKIADKRLETLEKLLKIDFDYIDKMTAATLAGYKKEEAMAGEDAEAKIAIAEKEVALAALSMETEPAKYEAAQAHLVEIKRKAAEQKQEIDDIYLKVQTTALLQEISNEEATLNKEYAAHQISANTLAASLTALEDRKTEIAKKGIEDRLILALNDPTSSPVAVAKMYAELESEDLAHQNRLSAIESQAAVNNQKLWQGMYTQMETGFTSAIVTMLNGTKTFQGAMQQLVKAMLDAFIEFLAKQAVQWAETQLANLAATKGSILGQIQSLMGLAGAGGVASMAAAPWPVDMTAPVFGASMAAEAASFAAAGAQEGYDVPPGLAPRTQLHPREMVLPEALADVIRSLAAAPGRAAGAGGTSNISIRALDSRSVERVLGGNSPAMARVMTKMFGAHGR